MTPDSYLAQHSAHDFDAVLARWDKIAAAAGLRKSLLIEDEGGFPVVVYESETQPTAESGLYLCAGVHGDEPGGVWGLVEWAEDHIDFLRTTGAVIFPCFNPSGLTNNTRHDYANRDLNRLFQDKSIPLMAAWQRFMAGRQFQLAIHLHEDYDARGIYAYELTRDGESYCDRIFTVIEPLIPREMRTEIDGNEFDKNAIFAASVDDVREHVETELNGGYPEAIFVFLEYARHALTFETPSEFSLWDRVQAQQKFIEESIREVGIR